MPLIRIAEQHWGKVWRELVAAGPISRLSQDRVYAVSMEQLELLRRKKLPFDLMPEEHQLKDGKNGQERPSI